MLFTIFWCLFFGTIAGVETHNFEKIDYERIMYFSGFALANHVLSTVNVKSPSHCVIHCLEHPSCQSINFKIIGNPEHVCELNDKTEDEVALTSNSDFKYYGPTELPEVNLIIYFSFLYLWWASVIFHCNLIGCVHEQAIWLAAEVGGILEIPAIWLAAEVGGILRFLRFDWLRKWAESLRFLQFDWLRAWADNMIGCGSVKSALTRHF